MSSGELILLKKRIDELCARAIATPEESPDLAGTFQELRRALREQSEKLRSLVREIPVHRSELTYPSSVLSRD